MKMMTLLSWINKKTKIKINFSIASSFLYFVLKIQNVDSHKRNRSAYFDADQVEIAKIKWQTQTEQQ